ncbi:MAG: Calx-beta domain-containing protein [Acidobacteriota bacterium]
MTTTVRRLAGIVVTSLFFATAASGQDFEVTGGSIVEGDDGVTLLELTVRMLIEPRPSEQITVQLSATDITAELGVDYSLPATLVFTPLGPRVKQFNVEVFGDLLVEGDETFELEVLDEEGTPVSGPPAVVEIIDDDFLTISVADLSVPEGDAPRTEGLTVSFSNAAEGAVTVVASASNGTAASGEDYSAPSLSVVVPGGALEATLDFTVLGDLIEEADETFFIDLTSTTLGTFGQSRAQITLIDDDEDTNADVTVSIADQSFTEGDVTRTDGIVITLSEAASEAITVEAVATDVSATSGLDYSADSLSVTVPVGEQAASFPFSVLGDLVDEPDETFSVRLTSTSAGSLGADEAVMTLIDDDSLPGLSVTDLQIIEGDSGAMTGSVQVTLTVASSATVRARLDSSDGTATAGVDYQRLSSTPVVFAPGETSVSVPVNVAGDVEIEGSETFTLTLSQPQNAGLADPQATVTIVDDDSLISLSESIVDGAEGGGDLELVVTRTGDLSQRLDLELSFDGVAQEGLDFIPESSQTTFLPGETRKSVPLLVVDDELVEDLIEELTATVSTIAAAKELPVSNATLGVPQSIVMRIRDNDQVTPTPPTVRFNRLRRSAFEDEGSVELFVERTGDTSGSASVLVSVSGGSATEGSDFTFATQRVEWAPGDPEPKSVSVGLIEDNVTEGAEQAIFQLSDPQSVGGPAPLVIGSPSATLLEILERSGAAFVQSVLFVTEGSTDVSLDVRRLGDTSSALTVEVCVDGGTASPADYVLSGTKLSWSGGDTRIQGALLDVPEDSEVEPRETLLLSLCNASTGNVISNLTVYFLDDDLPTQPIEPLGLPGDSPQNPAVAYGRGGQRVEVWQQADGSGFGIWARFIDSLGEPTGPDVLVNTTTAGDQTEPDVAIDYDGNVTIVWRDGTVTEESPKVGARAAGSAVVGRFFAPNGEAKTTDVIVSESEASDESNTPNVTASNTGDAVITWESDDQVQGRIYAKTTVPRTGILPISDLDEGRSATPRSTVGASGDFIVAWREEPTSGASSRVVVRIFNENGDPKSAQQIVTSSSTAQLPVIAADDDGEFVVAWEQETTAGWDVMARNYDRFATALGQEFLVSESADGSQRRPAIDRNAIGDFVIVWEQETAGAKAAGGNLVGRFFTPGGEPQSGEVEIAATEGGSTPVDADVSIADRDQTTVVFEREGPDGEPDGVFSITLEPLPAGEPCVESADTSCLNQGRFSVDARWQDFDLENGDGQAEVLTDDTSYFWFFDPANVEVVVKVLDACAVNGHYWVFAAGLTDTEVNLRIDDSASGETLTIFNPLGRGFQPVLDTRAFETCEVATPRPDASRQAALDRIAAEIEGLSAALGAAAQANCAADEEQMCLNGGRFGASIDWSTNQGTAGRGQQVTLTTDTGYFWFFEPDNVEVVVKVLDACAINGKYWVFAAGLTDVETDLQVVDSVTGAARSYTNDEGDAFSVVLDTGFFDCE